MQHIVVFLTLIVLYGGCLTTAAYFEMEYSSTMILSMGAGALFGLVIGLCGYEV